MNNANGKAWNPWNSKWPAICPGESVTIIISYLNGLQSYIPLFWDLLGQKTQFRVHYVINCEHFLKGNEGIWTVCHLHAICRQKWVVSINTWKEGKFTCQPEANKSALADAIWDLIEPYAPADNAADGSQYVLDGGGLVQCIPWSPGSTYTHGPLDLLIKTYATSIQSM